MASDDDSIHVDVVLELDEASARQVSGRIESDFSKKGAEVPVKPTLDTRSADEALGSLEDKAKNTAKNVEGAIRGSITDALNPDDARTSSMAGSLGDKIGNQVRQALGNSLGDSTINGALGSKIGDALGSQIGGALGSKIKDLLGDDVANTMSTVQQKASGVLDTVTSLAGVFSSLPGKIGEIAGAIGDLAGPIGAVVAGLGTFASLIWSLPGGLKDILNAPPGPSYDRNAPAPPLAINPGPVAPQNAEAMGLPPGTQYTATPGDINDPFSALLPPGVKGPADTDKTPTSLGPFVPLVPPKPGPLTQGQQTPPDSFYHQWYPDSDTVHGQSHGAHPGPTDPFRHLPGFTPPKTPKPPADDSGGGSSRSSGAGAGAGRSPSAGTGGGGARGSGNAGTGPSGDPNDPLYVRIVGTAPGSGGAGGYGGVGGVGGGDGTLHLGLQPPSPDRLLQMFGVPGGMAQLFGLTGAPGDAERASASLSNATTGAGAGISLTGFSAPTSMSGAVRTAGNIRNLYAVAESLQGTPYSQALRNDCSGMVAKLANAALGLPPQASFTTVNEGQWLSSHGFLPGMGGPGDLSIGWYDHGGGNAGHTAATLPGGVHAESGGAGGGFRLGPSAAGADNPEFEHRMHLPMGPGAPAGLAGAPTGARAPHRATLVDTTTPTPGPGLGALATGGGGFQGFAGGIPGRQNGTPLFGSSAPNLPDIQGTNDYSQTTPPQLGSGQGFGLTGSGLFGLLENLPGMAAGAAPSFGGGAAAQAVLANIVMPEINLAAQKGGQAMAVMAMAPFEETWLGGGMMGAPSVGSPANSGWPGKLLGSLVGSHFDAPNIAGTAQPPKREGKKSPDDTDNVDEEQARASKAPKGTPDDPVHVKQVGGSGAPKTPTGQQETSRANLSATMAEPSMATTPIL